jgi:hypothetical protein
MIYARGLGPVLVLALLAYAVLDIIATDDSRIQSLPKMMWIFVVVLIPIIGPVAWLLLGRPEGASWRIGGQGAVRPYRHDPTKRGVPPENLPRHRLPEEDLPPLESREDVLRRYYEEQQRRKQAEDRLREQLMGGDDPALGDGRNDGAPDGDAPDDTPEPD